MSLRFKVSTAGSYLTVPNDSSMEKRKEILPAGRGMKDVQVLILTPSIAARRACDGLHPDHFLNSRSIA